MNLDLDKLETQRKAATPGPWEALCTVHGDWSVESGNSWGESVDSTEANATYIANLANSAEELIARSREADSAAALLSLACEKGERSHPLDAIMNLAAQRDLGLDVIDALRRSLSRAVDRGIKAEAELLQLGKRWEERNEALRAEIGVHATASLEMASALCASEDKRANLVAEVLRLRRCECGGLVDDTRITICGDCA